MAHNARELILVCLITGLVMALYYSNAFRDRDDHLTDCRSRNAQIAEINERAPKLNALIRVEIAEPEHARYRHVLTEVEKVPLDNCEGLFRKPWPF